MPAHWSPPLPATPSLPALASTDRLHVSALPTVGVLRVEGTDAYTFLQGQITTDLREVQKGRVLPGAVCSLKGRVLFSFLAVPVSTSAVWLLLPEDQLGDALQHLKKYAVFSKVTLTIGATLAVAGLLAIGDETAAGLALPAPGMASHDTRLLLARIDARRCLLLGEATALADWLADAALPLVAANAWQLADIRAGLAHIPAALRDRHQPQELNYPALEGVSYQKGCYTGQEVVARLYFRGRLKQRLYRLTATCPPPAAGSAVLDANGKEVGEVVNAALAASNQTELLAIVRNDAMAAGGLQLASGQALAALELPYALDASKEE